MVDITSANLETNKITFRLGKEHADDVILSAVTEHGAEYVIAKMNLGIGYWTASLNPASLIGLPEGQYVKLRATWNKRSDEYDLRFFVLGSTYHSQYNVTHEIQCPAGAVNGVLTTAANPSCGGRTATQFRPDFPKLARQNGHGIMIAGAHGPLNDHVVTLPWTVQGSLCANYVQDNFFRVVPDVTGAWGVALDEFSVAIRYLEENGTVTKRHAHLEPQDRILIVGYGSGLGTVKTVKDKCGEGCDDAPNYHIDNFSLAPWCSENKVGDLPQKKYMTIRVNR